MSIKLYKKFFAMHLKSQMQYKISFFLLMCGNIFIAATGIIGIMFIFNRINEVEGFTFQEVLLCSAVMLMSFSLAETFARGFDTFPRMMGNGEFDRALVRPRPIIFLVLSMQIDFSRLARVATALAVFTYAIPASGVIWTWDRILTLMLMVVCGSILFFGLFLVYAAFTFFTVEGLEVMNILTDGGREHGLYPFSIYGERVLKFLTFIVPLALVQYYPFLYLIGRETNPIYMFTPVLSLWFMLPAYAFFRFGLSRYKSTGS